MSEDKGRKPFTAAREDGRSDARVIFELVSDVAPGTVFEFSQLGEALAEGLPDNTRPVTRARIGAAVRNANNALLKVHQRMLHSVARTGYRVARADEHRGLAIRREISAERQLRHGLNMLKNARLGEMDEVNRMAHLAHLQISQAIWSTTQRISRQQRRQDAAITMLTQRVQSLEVETKSA